MLAGLLYPTAGTATVLDHVPWRRERVFLQQIALVMGQRNQLQWDIPAIDSFALNQAIYCIDPPAYRRTLGELTDLLDLGPLLTKPVRTLSLGERMKCELAAALLHRPRVLFLDEPTIGQDVTSQRRIRTFIAEYNRRHEATALLTSHYMADVEALCRRVILIHHGQILFAGAYCFLDDADERCDPGILCRVVFPLGPDGATHTLPSPRSGAGATAAFPVDARISCATPAGTGGPACNSPGIGRSRHMAVFEPGIDDYALALWTSPLHWNWSLSMRYIALLKRYLQLNILRELAYRGNFYTQIFQSLVSLGFGLLGLAVIFDHTSALNEWHPAELLALLGIYQIVGGVINLVIQPCMQQLMSEVHRGTLDYTLLKPADAQFLVSIRQVQIWKLCDIVLGLIVVGVALARLGVTVGAGQVLTFVFVLGAGGSIVYSFWLMLATCSFWLVRVENILVIFQDLYQAGRWPVSIYPSWLRWTLTFLVPVTVATTIPAQALVGQLAWHTILAVASFALLALVLSRWFWLFGLRHYTGASA